MQNSLYKLFEQKCVLEVCVHIHPIMIKIHPVFFLIYFLLNFFQLISFNPCCLSIHFFMKFFIHTGGFVLTSR